jgi:hypothetical protein
VGPTLMAATLSVGSGWQKPTLSEIPESAIQDSAGSSPAGHVGKRKLEFDAHTSQTLLNRAMNTPVVFVPAPSKSASAPATMRGMKKQHFHNALIQLCGPNFDLQEAKNGKRYGRTITERFFPGKYRDELTFFLRLPSE